MLVKDISESIFLTRICKLRLRHHHNAREITHIQWVLLPLFSDSSWKKQHQMTFYFFTNASFSCVLLFLLHRLQTHQLQLPIFPSLPSLFLKSLFLRFLHPHFEKTFIAIFIFSKRYKRKHFSHAYICKLWYQTTFIFSLML